MLLALALFSVVGVRELGLGGVRSLAWKRPTAVLLMVGILLSSVVLVIVGPNAATLLVLLASAYRICNMARLVRSRVDERYLHRTTIRTSAWIIGLQMLLLAIWGFVAWWHVGGYLIWLLVTYGILAGSLVLLASTMRHVRTTRAPRLPEPGISDHDLPTLTVAIPARNETDDLEACLTSLVASNYPKLEILVLDDCSQSRRTPEIIRSYAHAGVRFVEGKSPERNWLAKNQAYQQLFEEANGELLLFAGV